MKITDFRHCLLASVLLCWLYPCLANSDDAVSIKVYYSKQQFSDAKAVQRDLDQVHWHLLKRNSGLISPQKGHSWLKLQIDNTSPLPQQRLIEFAFPVTSMDIYEIVDDQLAPQILDLGHDHEFSRRPFNYRHIIYPIQLKPDQIRTFIVDIDHSFIKLVKVESWTRSKLQQVKLREMIFFGMIYGALAMIVLYNLFIYLSIREKNHLLFVLFGSFTGLFIAMHEGHFLQFIGIHTDWPKSLVYAAVTALMCLFLSIFSISFLNISRWSGLMHKTLLGLGIIIACLIFSLGLAGSPVIFSPRLIVIIITLYSYVIFCGLYLRNQGVTSAGLFSLAIFLCTVGLIFDFVSNTGFISWGRWTFSYASIGNVLMILVFAFALADKMRLLNNEKLKTSRQLIKLSEEKAQTNIEVYKSRLNQVQLEQQADEAKIEIRAKSEFLATMSHQIRTPMNGVLGMTDLLDDTKLDHEQHQLVSSINKSAKSLLNVINDLLDYSKIESGKMELESKIFNLERIIDDCIIISALKATETKLNFTGYIQPGTELQLKGDAPKIRQITLNILNNVFSFSKNCDVLLYVHETGKRSINSLEIKISITSKGVLLSDQEKDAMLQPFHEGRSRKNGDRSFELGLALSQQLVELMQGDLGIDRNEKHQTTTFWFTCRLLIPHKKEVIFLTDRSKILSGRRILICDNRPDYLDAVKALTESWGMTCKAVRSNEFVADTLLSDDNTYQVLLISEELLTPEIQLAVRKSNLDHNFITSVTLLTKSRFSMTKSDMHKRGIQNVLEVPSTTLLLYQSLLKSMGIQPTESHKRKGAPLDIIIAEDNIVNQMVIVGLLKKLNYSPKIANNGIETLNLYKAAKTSPDLILMDCEMPELNGYDATREIRKKQLGQTHKTVIIGLSAHANPEYKELAFESGMDDFITKPVTIENIQEIIEKMTNGFFVKDNFESDSHPKDTTPQSSPIDKG